jgi:hypothetical protein
MAPVVVIPGLGLRVVWRHLAIARQAARVGLIARLWRHLAIARQSLPIGRFLKFKMVSGNSGRVFLNQKLPFLVNRKKGSNSVTD